MKEVSSNTLASVIARIADNKKASDIVILNIGNVSILADYFVICSAETTTQVRAITEGIREIVKDLFGRYPAGEESDQRNRWNLLDYGDVIIHILHKEEREFYAIEKFWNHACTTDPEVWMKESEEYQEYLR